MSLHSPYGFWINQPTFQGIRNRLYDNLIPKDIKSVLEIGAGRGEFAYYCQGRGIKYVGLEPNEIMCKRLIECQFEVYPYTAEIGIVNGFAIGRDNDQDCIFAAHLIEHLTGGEILNLFKAIKQRQAANRVVLLYPDIEKCGNVFYQDYTHTFPTTKKRIEDMLTDCGYSIERSGYYCGPFTNPILVNLIYWITKCIPMPQSWRARTQVCGFTIGGIV